MPLMDLEIEDKAGNPVLAVDTSQGIFEKMIPRYSDESNAILIETMRNTQKKFIYVTNNHFFDR